MDVKSAQEDTVGCRATHSVENVLEAEQQEAVQGAGQVQLGEHREQPALQEGPERTARQVLQGAGPLLQGEQRLVETGILLQGENRGSEMHRMGAELSQVVPLCPGTWVPPSPPAALQGPPAVPRLPSLTCTTSAGTADTHSSDTRTWS